MSQEDLIQEIQVIRRYSQLVLDRTSAMSLEDYLDDQFVRLAVERSIMIIGEASARIRDSYPDIYEQIESFRSAIGVRNRLAHGYDDLIDDEAIWSIVDTGLAALLQEIEKLT